MASRHRSNTTISARSMQRPDSRASTTSATSQHDAHQDGRSNQAFYMPQGPESALLQYQASMDSQESQMYPAHDQQHSMQRVAQSAQFPAQAYASHDASYLQEVPYSNSVRVGSVPMHNVPDLHDDKRRRGSAVTATNDKELRDMLSRNEGRPLRDVAQEVVQKERTPMAEKTKQLFAMLWLRAVCKPAKTSVPRNRVYSQYADRCATERVIPLNPASFGKLVRVIFPGIQTRRLGVRGESKYHYVDLALEDENAAQYASFNVATAQINGNRPRRSESASTQHIDFNNIPRLQADTAAFPTTELSFDTAPAHHPPTPRGPASLARTFAWPDARGMQPGSVEAQSYTQTLRFPSRDLPSFAENEPVSLPSIQPYLPPRTDNDTAEALCALYRTHCTSLIDSIRFCKEKQFFRLYTSFHGTLTVPVQKLFTHPNLAPWIEQCDLIMYRTMVRFVSRLVLQAAPVVVINILSNISANLHGHIAKTFAAQPAHVLEAKLRPAAIFAALLHRLIRVNQSAHAAANLLTIDQNREQMWFEWLTKVNPKRVMEAELPLECPYDEVYKILTSEMRTLLEPLQAPQYSEDPYGFQAYNFEENGSFATYLQNQVNSRPTTAAEGTSNVSTETILDRWSEFIYSLPARFPNAETRTLLHCISAIGTASLRDITIMNGQSYGHWWVLKIFVDELALWLAEMGGFLDPAPPSGQLQQQGNGSGSSYYQSPVLGDDGQHNNGSHSSGGSGPDSRIGSIAPLDPSTQNAPPSGASNGMNYERLNSFGRNETSTHHTYAHGAAGIDRQLLDELNSNAPSARQGFDFHQHVMTQQRGHLLQQQQDTDIDDSGIAMDEDVTMSKFGGIPARHSGQIGMMTQ